MSLCCSDHLPERVKSLSDKSKEGTVRVMPVKIEGVSCDCGLPAKFNISYQNKEGGYVWPRAIRDDEKDLKILVGPISDTSSLIDIKNPQPPKE